MVSLHVHPATVSLLRNVHEHLPGVVEQSNELTVSLIVWCESRGACLQHRLGHWDLRPSMFFGFIPVFNPRQL